MFSVKDIKTSIIREYGATYFLQCIAKQIGLDDVISKSCGRMGAEVFALAEYLILSGDPFAYSALGFTAPR